MNISSWKQTHFIQLQTTLQWLKNSFQGRACKESLNNWHELTAPSAEPGQRHFLGWTLLHCCLNLCKLRKEHNNESVWFHMLPSVKFLKISQRTRDWSWQIIRNSTNSSTYRCSSPSRPENAFLVTDLIWFPCKILKIKAQKPSLNVTSVHKRRSKKKFSMMLNCIFFLILAEIQE